jgi:hypothetical protein
VDPIELEAPSGFFPPTGSPRVRPSNFQGVTAWHRLCVTRRLVVRVQTADPRGRVQGGDASPTSGSKRHQPNDEVPLLIRPRYLFVVSRQHVELYELLIERFQDDRNVEVVLDRRAATPEQAGAYGESDRRQRRSADDDLTRRSHLIITRPD